MTQTILEYARLLGGAEEGQEVLLTALCGAAEGTLRGKLKEGVTPEDCGGAFPVAAAWLALAGLCAGDCAQADAAGWTAGAVSVTRTTPAGERAETLRAQAARLMEPYLRDESFFFQGVRG